MKDCNLQFPFTVSHSYLSPSLSAIVCAIFSSRLKWRSYKKHIAVYPGVDDGKSFTGLFFVERSTEISRVEEL